MNFSDVIGGIADITDIASGIVGIGVGWSEFVATVGGLSTTLLAIPVPVTAVIAGLGLVVGALALFGDGESEAEKQTRLFNEAQVESEVLKGFVSNLRGLADENGYVKNFEQAQYYVDQINSAMPGTVKLTEDGKLTWLENAEAIDENIKQLERKAKVEAYYDGYVESLKNETKLRSELTLAQNNYNTELEKQQEYQAKYNELMAKSREARLSPEETESLTHYREQIEASNEKLGQYSEKLDKAKGAYEANAKGAELYNQAVGALDGSVTASALLQAEEYTKLDENGTSTWDSLAAASEDCKSRVTTAQGDELATVQATSALIQAEMVNKALSQGLSYDQMISQLEEKGVQLNDTEKEQLKTSFNQWQMNSEDIKNAQAKGLDTLKLMKLTALSKMNENDKSKLSENVKLFAEKGDASGIELCNKLAASLEANNGEITDETKEIMADIEARAAAADPTAQVDVNEPTDKNLNDVKKKVDKAAVDRKAKMTLEAETDKKSFTLIFKEVLPFYLFIGMTNDEFYFQDVELAKCYRQVYEIKEDRHNSHMWLQGMYIYDAISTSLYNVFCRKSRQQAKAKVWMNMLVNCYE
ncbi:hypothetical protein [Coprobacillus cateniformis]|uniref:hypothetical protein n=1 Tax=Coprobacillus cateniformis TaxID=100884 RepID=UPI001F27AE73|nr:hypothetical protein [Coprobacillus cateniformis]